jgi:hypothetical protein
VLIEWQCGACGAWLSDGFSAHWHIKTREPGLDEMIQARRMDEMLPGSACALDPLTSEQSLYLRTGKEPTREKQL